MKPRRHGRRRCAVLCSTIFATLALACVAAPLAAAAVTIGAPGVGGGYEFGGGPYVASIGQVVTAPAGVNTLESFALSPQAPSSFVFRAYVYAWNGSHATGPALYESGDLHATSSSSFQPLTIETGGVPVAPGQQYVLFLSRSAEQSADGSSEAGYALQVAYEFGPPFYEPEPPYREGGLVTLSNGYTPSEWGTKTWSDFGQFEDAAFEATFDEVQPPVAPTPTEPVPNPPVTSPPAPVARCVVPDLHGLTVAEAKRALRAADCSLGVLERHYYTLPTGEVMEQDVHQGTFLPPGGTVDVWISRGAHRRKR